MSVGGSGGSGQIRYALLLDSTQAEQGINKFKTGLTNLQGPTQQVNRSMTSIGDNIKTVGTQATSLGSKIKTVGSNFSTLAIGLGSTVSQVVNLGRQYRDLQDTQIAVDRTTRKLSLANEAVEKATTKLEEAIRKYGKGSKEAKQATVDLTQAQAQQKIATDVQAEALETQSDAYTNFATGVVPAVITAVGTVGSSFKGLAVKGTALTGVMSKLTSGIGSAGLLGAIGPLALAIGPLVVSYLAWKDASEEVADVSAKLQAAKGIPGLTDRIKEMNTQLDRLKAPFKSPAFDELFKIAPLSGVANPIIDITKKINEENQKRASILGQVTIFQEKYDEALRKHNDALSSRQKGDEIATKAALDLAKADLDNVKALAARTKGTDNMRLAVDQYNKTQGVAIERSGGFFDIIQDFGPSFVEITKNTNDLNAALAKVGQSFVDARPDNFFEFLQKTPIVAKKLETGASSLSIAIAKVGVNVVDTAEKNKQLTESMKTASSVARNWITNVDNVQPALEKVAKAQAEFNKQLQEATGAVRTTFKVESNVDKIMNQVKKLLPNKIEKKIDMKLDFGQKVEDTRKALNNWLLTATTVDDKTADAIGEAIIEQIDNSFKKGKIPTEFTNLKTQIQTALKDPSTPDVFRQLLLTYDWTGIGIKIGTDTQTGLNKKPITATVTAQVVAPGGGKGLSGIMTGAAWEKALGIDKIKEEDIKIEIPQPVVPAPDTTAFGNRLLDAAEGVRKWVKFVDNAKTKIPPPNTKEFGDRLLDAAKGVKAFVKFVNKAETKLKKVDLSDFNSSLNTAVSNARSAASKINNALSGSGVQSLSSGGIFSLAKGGIISAQSGNISTTHGPKMSVLWGDNPGGTETHAFIPHNNPTPTLEKLFEMFFKGGIGGGSGGDIIINAAFKIEGNDIINTRELKRQFRRDSGTGRWRFG